MIRRDHALVMTRRMVEGDVTIVHLDRRVGKDEIDDADDEAEPFDETLKRLTIELDAQLRESAELEQLIRANLQEVSSET
jgi:hypothetical protein